MNDSYEKDQKVHLTGRAIEILDNDLKTVWAKQRSEEAFRAQTNLVQTWGGVQLVLSQCKQDIKTEYHIFIVN